jgi:integrase/recombinase XerC
MTDSFLRYLQFEKRVSPNTVLAYQNDLLQLEQFLEKTFPGIVAAHAEYGALRSWIIHLVESGIEPVSVNRKMATLRSFYKFLLRQEVISKDPMMKIKILKTKKKLPTFIKESEIVTLLDQPANPFPETYDGYRDKAILELFYATGIRLSELMTLREDNINLRERTIKVLGKRNKERVIPFAGTLVPILEAYRNVRNKEVSTISDYFFVTSKGDRCYPMMIYRMVKKYLDDNTSVDRRSPHVLRHTFATHLLNNGAEINAVKDLLGHSSLAATQVYTHNSMEKLKKVFEQAHPKA